MINKDTLRSSIKAYCLELMKETSTSGGAGGYLTKKVFRSTKKQDLKSPTGFESSPNPNMYTKTMKFKIVKPKERLNSKDLWKEIKINTPGLIKTNLTSGDKNNIIVYKRNLKYSDYKGEIEKSLEDQGYDDRWDRNEVTWSLISFPDSNNPNKQYWWTDDEINWNIKEIKINNPTQLKLIPGQYYDILRYRGNQAVKEFKKHPRFYSLEEIKGEKVLWELGYKYNGLGNEEFDGEIYSYHNFIEPWDGDEVGWGVENVKRWIENKLIRKGLKQENSLNESRYNQFKKSKVSPKPKDILHKAIKEIQFKLDEVNRLIEFTTRIKGELCEGDQEIEYLKRTKDSIRKIYKKLKETFDKMSSIDELNNQKI